VAAVRLCRVPSAVENLERRRRDGSPAVLTYLHGQQRTVQPFREAIDSGQAPAS